MKVGKTFASRLKTFCTRSPFCKRKIHVRSFFSPLHPSPPSSRILSDNVNRLKHFPFFHFRTRTHIFLLACVSICESRAQHSQRALRFVSAKRHKRTFFHSSVRANKKKKTEKFSLHFIFSIIFFLYTSSAEITFSLVSIFHRWRRTTRGLNGQSWNRKIRFIYQKDIKKKDNFNRNYKVKWTWK